LRFANAAFKGGDLMAMAQTLFCGTQGPIWWGHR